MLMYYNRKLIILESNIPAKNKYIKNKTFEKKNRLKVGICNRSEVSKGIYVPQMAYNTRHWDVRKKY